MGGVPPIIDVYSFLPVGIIWEKQCFSFKYLFIMGFYKKYNVMIVH